MVITNIADWLGGHWVALACLIILSYILNNRYGGGLNKYPGPALAPYTNFWRFWDVHKRQHEHTQIALHRKLGDIVRLGPRIISFSNPRAIKDIYGLNTGFYKTEFFPVQNNVKDGVRIQSLFSTRDEDYHARFKRCVNSAFSMSTLVSFEGFVDETTQVFLRQTHKLFCESQYGKTCDFARWLQFYAFDVIGHLSFSKRFGFIERFEDIDGIVAVIADILKYSGEIGQIPWVDRYLWRKNPIKMWLMRNTSLFKSSNGVAKFATDRSAERREELTKLKASEATVDNTGERKLDFLSRFALAQKANPDFMTDFQVLAILSSLVNAGSDTTASSLSAVFYFLLRNPQCYARLMGELDTAAQNEGIFCAQGEYRVVAYNAALKLPYLDAVIQESFRLFPAVGLLLERHVPPGGANICGEYIPGGTIVGCNAWVLHRREEVFGSDVDTFRPERWLDASPAQLKTMKGTMFHFGAGPRTCIGKNISLLEIYKLVPSFLLAYEIRFEDASKAWTTENCWFVRQLGFNCCFKPRK